MAIITYYNNITFEHTTFNTIKKKYNALMSAAIIWVQRSTFERDGANVRMCF